MTSNKLASYKSLMEVGTSTLKLSFSVFFLCFFSLLDSFFFEKGESSIEDQVPQELLLPEFEEQLAAPWWYDSVENLN